MGNSLERRVVIGVLILLVAAGLFLRLRDLAARPLWLDEASFWKTSLAPMAQKLTWRHHFEHPPLAYVLEGWSLQALGERPEWVVRLPSLVWGLLCIPAAFLLGRVVGGDRMGLMTAALASLDPLLVEQSRQARMYTLFILLLLLALSATIVLLRRGAGTRWQWIGLGALQASLGWTSHAAIAAWAGQIVGIAWALRSRRDDDAPLRRGLLWAGAATLVLWSPGIFRIARRVSRGMLAANASDPVSRVAIDLSMSVWDLYGIAWLVLIPITLIGVVVLYRRQPIARAILAGIAILNVAGLMALRALHPFLASRYLVAVLPSIWVTAAAFALWAPRRAPAVAAFGLLLVGLVVVDLGAERPGIFRVGEEIRALAPLVAGPDAVVFLPRYIGGVGEYYGVEPAPRPPKGEPHPPLSALEGRSVWFVAGNFGASGNTGQARDYVASLLRLRGGDAHAAERITAGYAGVLRVDPDGRVTAWRPVGNRLVLDGAR